MTVSYVIVPVGPGVDVRCQREDKDVWLDVVPICEELALDLVQEWAEPTHPRTKGVYAVRDRASGNDGRSWPVRQIHYQSIPLWLGSIRLSQWKGTPTVERKLVLLKEHCAIAVYNYFFNNTNVRALVPSAQAGPSADHLDLLVQVATGLRDLARRQDEVGGAIQEAQHLAQVAVNLSTRCHGRRTVRAYLHAWRIDMHEWEAGHLGTLIAAAARRRGIREALVPDTRHYEVHSWPDDFMEEWFTNAFGPRPTGGPRRRVPMPT